MTAFTPIRKSALSELDWIVVEMARADGPRSLNPDGFIARFTQSVFGIPIARSLANDRLEALRRYSVRAWYWDFIRPRDIRPLLDAGYSKAQGLEILAHVAAFRGFTPSVQDDAAWSSTAGLIQTSTLQWRPTSVEAGGNAS